MLPALREISCLLQRKRIFSTLLHILQIKYYYSDRCLHRDLSRELQVYQGRWPTWPGEFRKACIEDVTQLYVGWRTKVLLC